MQLAFDRSVRQIDSFGRLHVSISNICMATVSPYYGWEIPEYKELGLNADHIYQVFRPPEELEKAANTANNIQILSTHVPVHADDPQQDLVVGSTGTDAAWADPYVTNSLVFTVGEAIEDIKSRDKVELSPCYAYKPVLRSGVFKGQSYTIVMTDISFNHIAQVESGRQGPSVTVADSKGPVLMAKLTTRKALLVHGALIAHVSPRLAADAKIDLTDALGKVTAKGYAGQIPGVAKAVAKAVAGKLAADANLDDLPAMLQRLATDADMTDEDDDLTEDDEEETPAEKAARLAAAKDAEEDEDNKTAKDAEEDEDDKPSKAAMDKAIADAVRGVAADAAAMRQAERDVLPVIGEIKTAMDSAAALYRLALDHLEVEYKGVHASAYPALLKQAQRASTPAPRPAALAADAAAASAYATRYAAPAARIKQL